MKIKLFIFTTIISCLNLKAQNELRLSFNSGLFSYSGNAARSSTDIYIYDNTRTGYTIDPYGANNAFCYGLSLNFKSVSKKNLVFGLDTGYEILRSSVSIRLLRNFTSSPWPGFESITGNAVASGETVVTNSVINLNPFIGKRFKSKDVSVDLVGGFDFCHILSAREKGDAHIDGNPDDNYKTNRNIKTINYDLRPRIQISLDYKRIGFYLGYCQGIISHSIENDNINSDVKSRFIRLGLTGKLF